MYTYLIGWSATNKWYYGVRYAEKSTPLELWTTYFTSSKHVAAYRKQHGEPDVVEIRRTFDTPDKAREWEHKVLRRLGVRAKDEWLNMCDNRFPFVTTNKQYMQADSYRKAMSLAKRGSLAWNKGLTNPKTVGTRFFHNGHTQGMFREGDQPAGWVRGRLNQAHNKGKPHSPETKAKIGAKSRAYRLSIKL